MGALATLARASPRKARLGVRGGRVVGNSRDGRARYARACLAAQSAARCALVDAWWARLGRGARSAATRLRSRCGAAAPPAVWGGQDRRRVEHRGGQGGASIRGQGGWRREIHRGGRHPLGGASIRALGGICARAVKSALRSPSGRLCIPCSTAKADFGPLPSASGSRARAAGPTCSAGQL